jgi:hypothetical protein
MEPRKIKHFSMYHHQIGSYEAIVRKSLETKIVRGNRGEIITIERQEIPEKKVKLFIRNSSNQGI